MKRHFSNYLSKKDAEECCRRDITEITLTPTAFRQTPEKTLAYLREKGIKILVQGVRGRPRRLTQKGVKRVLAMRQRGLSYFRIARLTGIPKSTVFDYCKRQKGVELREDEILEEELREAKQFLEKLQRAGLSDELTSLAKQGYQSSNPEEITFILKEIEKVVEAYR